MTNQPYEDHERYQQQGWPAQQGYDEDAQAAQQHTQQWQGQTWDTQVHRPVQAAPETAYIPQQDYAGEPQGYGPAQGAPGAGAYGSAAAPDPAYGPQATSGPEAYGSAPTSSDRAGHGHASAASGPAGYGSAGYGSASTSPDPAGHGHASTAPGPAGHGPGHTAPGPAGHGPAPMATGPAGHAYAPASAGPVHGSAQAHPGTAPHGSASDPSGYGPATVAGNARVTDAQRARLEGRSPIIEPGIQPAALTALLGLLLSGTAAIGSYALLVPLVVLQAVTAAGWFRLNGMWPARQGIALAFLGALVADAALLAAGRENAPAAILGTLGVWVLLSLVMQLRSHADPDERMYGLMATVASAALAIMATGHLAADPDAVTVGAAAVAVAVLARTLPLPTPASVVVSLLAAAGAGIAVGGMTGLGPKGALLGAGAAVCALIGHRVASYDYPSRFVHFTAGVALPLAAAAPAVYVLGRAIG
ncbi:hypothetical protein [Streptomyces doebereineriae]|uniref:Membrane protein YfcA n=1 Tax=Streptomyces doebereineriae TaxID=3075528 RepID=A0ABU2VHX6_9ACTN|nr:hypothetical protein [Streptomyces sp. DSM 41640]MDT0485175.1 hypothetical protein [Streptomyces sp. DSM 41640]